MKRALTALLVAAASAAVPSLAQAQAQPAAPDRGAFVLGLRVGGLFAQPFTEGRLGASFLTGLEVGYVLPVLRRGLGVLADVSYTQPTATGTTTDPRVTSNGGMYTWNLTQRELVVGFTVMYRLTLLGSGRVAPYIGIGPRLFFLQSLVTGSAGSNNPISETREQSLRVGLTVPLGVDIGLGPGRVFGEALVQWAPLSHQSTGDANVGSLSVLAGYRLFL